MKLAALRGTSAAALTQKLIDLHRQPLALL